MSNSRILSVTTLARVEGEGALHLRFKGREVEEARLTIFEPPRFFEAFLRGRRAEEVSDITARICGICPVAYQMSAVHALESAAGVSLPPALADLRRLLYCGEWIESHALHIYFLHAPDFFGLPDSFALAREHGAVVRQGLELKKIGNRIMQVLGGREIHPINVRLGGFYRLPKREDLAALRRDLERGLELACATARWAATLPFPEFERPYAFVALRQGQDYPMNFGRVVSSTGLDLAVQDYPDAFQEVHEAHSTALHSVLRTRSGYLVGPLARFALNHDCLTPQAAALARELGFDGPCRNPFKSIVVRGLELVVACEEGLRLIDGYHPPDAPFVPVAFPEAVTGHAATEAPRGLLYHRYQVAAGGEIAEAVIVPPTAQTLKTMEEDLRAGAGAWVDLPDEALQGRCEQVIRNHDPCISCATHFLNLHVTRSGESDA